MNSEDSTKYDIDLDKGTTEWAGERITKGMKMIDKRNYDTFHDLFVF